MTLRHRLLLVYLIVMLLSVATVGVAVYELNRTQRIYGALQNWHDVVLVAQKLKAAFPPPEDVHPQENEFTELLARQRVNLASARDFIDVTWIQDRYLEDVSLPYLRWARTPGPDRPPLAVEISGALEGLAAVLESDLELLNHEADKLNTRKWMLLGSVSGLTVLHVLVIGWLLRRWLLWPMERLNRQVEALAKDQPSPEPLLTSPLEMARLATALDRARQSLQVYRQQLIDAERLTTIGQFAAQLAHNLRNPLASIRAAAQVTARHERGNGYVEQRMGEVVACVDRLNQWIGGLMEIARREATPTRSEDIVPLLWRVHEAMRPELAAKEVTLSIEAPAEGLRCIHDPATLEQVLIAMIVNAIEASPLGGAIVLRAERVEGEKRRGDKGTRGQGDGGMEEWKDGQMEGWRDGEQGVCRISVEDEGPGVPAEDPERIFEFSYSTKQKGMGLGLTLARLALERQGGQAHACNRPEGGARVYVELPIGESEAWGGGTVKQ